MLVGNIDADTVQLRQALPCRNEAPAAERTRRFQIDARAVLNEERALQVDQRIVGFYHPHPKGPLRPSH
jgi:proteasome lid subunit RPN8/RPN11